MTSPPDLPKSIYSRVTIMDRATLFVTESSGDFASTVLEQVVADHVPSYTHNPPTIILLESGFNEGRAEDLPLTEMTPLAQDAYDALLRALARECDASSTQEPRG